MGKPKKFAPAQLKQLDGEAKINLKRPVTLDQILGDTGTGRYGTLDENVYTQQLKDMVWSDLQRHATENGIIPTDDRARLINKLIAEFRNYSRKYAHVTAPPQITKEKYSKVAKLMADAK